MYLCLCKAISDQVVKKIIAEKKASTVQEVQQHCPIGGGCGMCIDKLKELLEGQSGVPKQLTQCGGQENSESQYRR